jgi:hypothetical protein
VTERLSTLFRFFLERLELIQVEHLSTMASQAWLKFVAEDKHSSLFICPVKKKEKVLTRLANDGRREMGIFFKLEKLFLDFSYKKLAFYSPPPFK